MIFEIPLKKKKKKNRNSRDEKKIRADSFSNCPKFRSKGTVVCTTS
jgi:hypothetical protein